MKKTGLNMEAGYEPTEYKSLLNHTNNDYLNEEAKPTLLKYIFLLLSALCLTGNYYAYDIPAALNIQLMSVLNIDEITWQYKLASLYCAYSLPNILLPFFISKYIDKVGSKLMLLILCLMVMLGQYLIGYGLQNKGFNLMLFGRLIVGMAGESIGVAQARLTCHWFGTHELGLALSINLGIARLGSVLSDVLSPYIAINYNQFGLGTIHAVWFGWYMCFLSFICSIFLITMDNFYHKPTNHNEDENGKYDQVNTLFKRYSNIIDSEYNTFQNQGLIQTNEIEQTELNSNTTISCISYKFWIVCSLILCGYGAVIPFTNIASYLLQRKWYPNQPQIAGILLATPDLICTLLVPILNLLIKGVRTRFLITLICGIGLFSAHLLISLTDLNSPIEPMVLLGFFYALFTTSVWGCIPFFVADTLLPLAYSTSTSILNIGLSLSPFLVAKLINYSDQFVSLERYFCLLGLITFAISFYMLIYIYFSEIPFIPSRLEEEIAEDYESVEEEFDVESFEDNYVPIKDSNISTLSQISRKSHYDNFISNSPNNNGIDINKYTQFNASKDSNLFLNSNNTINSNDHLQHSNDSVNLNASAASSSLSVSPLFYSLSQIPNNPITKVNKRAYNTTQPPILPLRFSNVLLTPKKQNNLKKKKSRASIFVNQNNKNNNTYFDTIDTLQDTNSIDEELGLGSSNFAV